MNVCRMSVIAKMNSRKTSRKEIMGSMNPCRPNRLVGISKKIDSKLNTDEVGFGLWPPAGSRKAIEYLVKLRSPLHGHEAVGVFIIFRDSR